MRENQTKIESKIESASHIDVDPSFGLSTEQIKIRQEEGLTNNSPKRVTKSYFKIFKDNLLNFFNILLFAIGALLLIAHVAFDDFRDIKYYFFLFILGANIIIGVFQDIHARKLVDKLKVVSSYDARVLRNGKEETIQSKDVVLSDIVILKTGDQIIADAIVVEGKLECNESLLTGEADDVKKDIGSQVYSGSYVTSGTAKVRVIKVGKANYAEKLQDQAKAFNRPKSEIIRSLNSIFKYIGITVIVFAIAVIATYLVESKLSWPLHVGNNPSAVKEISGSLVSMIPTGMYLLTSTTLAVGVIRLARKRMLVQELYCIEMLARVDTLCLDKTGTITDGTMNVSEVVPTGKLSKVEVEKILISVVKGTGDTNSTASAILNAYNDIEPLKVVKSFPFNSAKKLSMVQTNDGYSYVLGAREFVPYKDKKVVDTCVDFENNAKRVLVIGRTSKPVDYENELPLFEIVGVLVLEDHIRDDAYENIAWFKSNGVKVKIISGDNALSVSKIAQKVGVDGADQYVSLEGMSLEEVSAIANKFTVFGRVNPEQKEALVRAMRAEKHIVAMTGDGVNDILALKSADCSIAMASGSAAARNVSHLVSLESNFSTLPDVVAEGRRVINNLQRTCSLFLVKTIFAVLITLLCLIRAWSNHGETGIFPFVTPNLFLWEFATIGVSSLFLSLQPNNERLSGNFVQNILSKAIPHGLTTSIVTISILAISWIVPDFLPPTCATALAVLAFTAYSFFVLFLICRPFDIYRIVLYIAVFLVSAIGIILDSIVLPAKDGISFILAIDYHSIVSNPWIIPLGIGVVVLAFAIWFGLDFATRRIINKINKGEK